MNQFLLLCLFLFLHSQHIFENGNLKECIEHISVDSILIDGKSSNDVGELVLKDREMLGNNGLILISATVDKRNKKIKNDLLTYQLP